MVYLLSTDNIYKRTCRQYCWLFGGLQSSTCSKLVEVYPVYEVFFLGKVDLFWTEGKNGEGEGGGTWRFKSHRIGQLNYKQNSGVKIS
jgi:hypothetical protein